MNEVKLLWVHNPVTLRSRMDHCPSPEEEGVPFPNTLTDTAQTYIFTQLGGDNGLVLV